MSSPLFYKVDSSRVTLREYTFGTRNPILLAIAATRKLFRLSMPSSTDDPPVESLEPFQVPDLPRDLTILLAPEIAELEDLGFRSPVYHLIPDFPHHTSHAYATFLHNDGLAIARLRLRSWNVSHPPKLTIFTEFLTPFTDGTLILSSSSKKQDLLPAPRLPLERLAGASPTDLWTFHRRRIYPETGQVISPIITPESMLSLLTATHTLTRDFHLARKVFRPLADADLAKAKAREQSRQSLGGHEYADILLEIERLQNKRGSWRTAILILLISAVAFIALAGGVWEWEFILILLPALFLHELGHYLAMRLFGYRDLRMFFIPFLGAAVTGRNYNAPAWKKAVVSLAGPVPSILLGVALGLFALTSRHDLLLKSAAIVLLLNGLNLLPILPLDGGWVLHATLFARNVLLDVAFRACAAMLLLTGAFFIGDKALLLLGIVTLVSLPGAYRIARVTADLRRAHLRAVAADDQTLPPEVATPIIDRLKQSFPKGMTNAGFARYTLHVFETLNARPPGAGATVALLSVHAGSFLLAAVVAFVFIAKPDLTTTFQRLPEPVATAASPFGHPLNPAAVSSFLSPDFDPDTRRLTLIATHDSPDAAQATVREVTLANPSDATMVLLGQTVLLSLPEDDRSLHDYWRSRLRQHSPNLFTDSANARAAFTLDCTAADPAAAVKLAIDIATYLKSPEGATPPWEGHGMLPLINGRPIPAGNRFRATGGATASAGAHLLLNRLTFENLAAAAPALAAYLQSQNCTDFHYDVRPASRITDTIP